jgi:hypothetical protein
MNEIKLDMVVILKELQILQKIQWEVRARILVKGKFQNKTGNGEIFCNLGIDKGILV